MSCLYLYSRPDCHLCEEAAALVGAVAPGVLVDQVDIEPDLALITRYGVRVPVLRRSDTGAELDWPFDADALRRFLAPPTNYQSPITNH